MRTRSPNLRDATPARVRRFLQARRPSSSPRSLEHVPGGRQGTSDQRLPPSLSTHCTRALDVGATHRAHARGAPRIRRITATNPLGGTIRWKTSCLLVDSAMLYASDASVAIPCTRSSLSARRTSVVGPPRSTPRARRDAVPASWIRDAFPWDRFERLLPRGRSRHLSVNDSSRNPRLHRRLRLRREPRRPLFAAPGPRSP